MISCGKQRYQDESLEQSNGVYYWRTDLHLDSTERAFLKQHHINKVYCRYFDVVMSDDGTEPKPNATIAFTDTLPAGIELIPTVYITEDCMQKPHKDLAEKLVKRIMQMNETNHIGNVHEIQIDCDYTSKSRATYYQFLETIKSQLSTIHYQLSTTIRLHQLSMPVPPVDYGVLMVYNTGDPRKWQERNPILDYRDVYPYLNKLAQYQLPLAAAYPVYQWIRNIQNVRIEHTIEAAELLKVKKTLEKERPCLSKAVITYHLETDNINRYKTETYEEIYHH
ncbi:hypothetical protein PRMUPPPA20_27890 [Xylanibacter ruminicola]|uniref:Replication restart DNA helicase PriA n=1 Tax=Xylanibacter ruminicola TaxID=839 RepID=A0AA37I359_XYLRU|nr:hypothetical protein [Xylanibacter ruminicola]GJG34680.1 hypothetical protein PRMUPPPA20_27890 [Xylanibacter ruminicola]SEH89688.1 replication restart DNA helicase PriA [Xylanibacter ruminicola]